MKITEELKYIKTILIYGLFFMFSLAMVTYTLGLYLDLPPINILIEFMRYGYRLHHNYIDTPLVGPISFNIYIMSVFFIALLLTGIFNKYFNQNNTLSSQQSIFLVGCIAFVFYSANQLYNYYYYYDYEKELFGGKNLHERNAILYHMPVYRYSQFCLQNIKGHQNAKLITDIDISREPGMLGHRMLAYFLYPVDIRNVRKKEPDYLLYYMKKDADQHIPDDFEIVARINKDNLIAKRK